jgi:hypothetical protein
MQVLACYFSSYCYSEGLVAECRYLKRRHTECRGAVLVSPESDALVSEKNWTDF